MKNKVLFLTNYPAPYRVDFFNEWGKQVDLTVLFFESTTEQTHRSQEWFDKQYENFTAVFLSKNIRFRRKKLCTDVIKYLKKEWDMIISGGYAEPTQMLAFTWLKHHHKSFFLEMDGGLTKEENIFQRTIKQHFISMPTGWISSGKATNQYLLYYGAQEKKIEFYPFTSLKEGDFAETEKRKKIKKSDLKTKLGISEDKVIISVGRFSYKRGYGKGFDLLIRLALELDKQTGVYIIGDEPTQEFMEMKKENKITNIHFIEFKQKDELLDYYLAADLFVLLTREDVWGLVINEAMMCRLPVITTNRCGAGLNLITNEKNGYIVPTDNYIDVLAIIKDVLPNDRMLKFIGNNGFDTIRNYTIEEMVKSHNKILTNKQSTEGA